MKLILPFLFIIFTFLSISKPTDETCMGPQYNVLSSSDIQCNDQNSLDVGGHSSSSSSDHHAICHNCHLGHCSFTLSEDVAISDNQILFELVFIEKNMIPSNFLTSLFRPPIS